MALVFFTKLLVNEYLVALTNLREFLLSTAIDKPLGSKAQFAQMSGA